MTHPCVDHPCDHCYLCDVVGICCQTARQSFFVTDDSDADLRRAILAESASIDTLAHLIRIEALSANQTSSLWLPAPALALPSPMPIRLPVSEQIRRGQTR